MFEQFKNIIKHFIFVNYFNSKKQGNYLGDGGSLVAPSPQKKTLYNYTSLMGKKMSKFIYLKMKNFDMDR